MAKTFNCGTEKLTMREVDFALPFRSWVLQQMRPVATIIKRPAWITADGCALMRELDWTFMPGVNRTAVVSDRKWALYLCLDGVFFRTNRVFADQLGPAVGVLRQMSERHMLMAWQDARNMRSAWIETCLELGD